ncbi:hypothetical protein M9H77_08218 [Catharanthus roseus]|uniref:Uncharacterized protein n=1 Tax=Catharanthus roseus TaxID=4058 RepID=A0ACC0BXF6_CATRO|nr:hypothetical protein M9H77_08218 [Catharanthus roseus]
MDSEMRSPTDLLHKISIGPISKVRETRHLVKGVLSPVFPEDPGVTLTSPPDVAVTEGRKKTNSTKRDKSHWEHSSGSGSGSESGSLSGSGSRLGSRGRGNYHKLLREGTEGATVAKLGSTTVLPLYLYSDRPGGTFVIGLLTEQQHFIQLQMHDGFPIPLLHVQWIYHRTERVSNWAYSYQERIVYWNARVARNRK